MLAVRSVSRNEYPSVSVEDVSYIAWLVHVVSRCPASMYALAWVASSYVSGRAGRSSDILGWFPIASKGCCRAGFAGRIQNDSGNPGLLECGAATDVGLRMP